MQKDQHLWLKLAEECTKLAHMALKVHQFGPTQVHPTGKDNNITRAAREMLDVVAIVQMLRDDCKLDLTSVFSESDTNNHILNKKRKIYKYYELTKQLGRA